ncbi:adenine phosphoribosyltransferase [Anaerotignum lactatifermentans]|uniref:Adenine phosphoribosyltransferase n=1 Tax=Anaerotignum lactatifermentans TaxID=160404 RepID=A0ABS2G577_9FIRM|nr:adenine phosphoribosyltransferase [Anaerotignum lactatifermentans]MBM6828261.1 adenine phosphoribosyltransferase [Anaerotignum lactatifermentans]MBM6876576.1 adenine phosphoribosyltransferase [Anaerotignum lactatifermentans]MBM6949844.1 adenine phosphoribosyltransferase [Anaerotignum lactatifermentans]
MDLKEMIREIPDFPEKGVLFRDVTTLLKDGEGLCAAVDLIQKELEGVEFDAVLGPESRGFIFGMPVAYNLKKGFIPVRKKGKLPAEVISREYALEYGTATIEIHKDAIHPGMKLVVIDDLMATGGTARALVDLIQEAGAEVVKLVFLIELDDLKGREVLEGYDISSVLHY